MDQLFLNLKTRVLTFILIAWTITSIAQRATISGKLLDATTNESLAYANVYINNTTIGTVTNYTGEFEIKNVSYPAVYEIVFSYVGYESYKQRLSITDEKVALGIVKLKPLAIELNAVEVKSTRDKEWEKKLKRFSKIFLGEDKFADLCTIINPFAIDFAETEKKFIAKATAPIEIENRALGYRIHFSLNKFESYKAEYTIEGNVRFENLEPADKNEVKKWDNNRQKSYLNSRQHLFKTILDKKLTAEGFQLYTEKEGVSTTSRAPVFSTNLDAILKPYDTLGIVTPTQYKDVYKLTFKGRMEVHYTPGETYTRVYRDITYPISWIWPNKPFILVNKDGIELNPLDVTISGNMNSNRVSHLMPLDYKPTPPEIVTAKQKEVIAKVPLEKIYLHTDKPYYYPGEIIWFKGYINYSVAAAADTLSKTAYVELIQKESKSIVLSKTIRIDSGTFAGELTLPDSLRPANYLLRSYTSWNRNFKESDFFLKSVPVLNLRETIELLTSKNITSSDNIEIHTEKNDYKTREKVFLILQMKDQEDPISNLSVSVVDDTQVSPIESNSILKGFKINSPEVSPQKKYQYPIERGITLTGKFFNDNGAPTKAPINVVQMNPNNFYFSESNENGYFKIQDLQFSDTSYFSIQTAGKKGELSGRAELVRQRPASLTVVTETPPFKIITTPTVMRRKSIFDSDEAQMLQEVVIKDVKEEPLEKKRPYGKSNYVLQRKDINTNYPNLLYAIQGKFPGLIVREVNNPDGGGSAWMVYTTRAATGSINNVKEVTVLVNDVFMGGTPASVLSSIHPDEVESIELKTSISVIYGAAGSAGVLSIYTTKMPDMPLSKKIPTLKVAGYSSSKKFKAPDYSSAASDPNKNINSLIYWNPFVKTGNNGSAIVSFFTGDLPTNYRIVVEGITLKDEVIHTEYLIKVIER